MTDTNTDKKSVNKELDDRQLELEELYASKPVPHSMRRGWLRTAAIYSGICASIGAAMTGSGLIVGLPFGLAMLALILGIAILIVCVFVPMGKIGSRFGLNTYIIGEAAFGRVGSNIAAGLVLSAIPGIGWYGIQLTMATDAVAAVFPMNKTVYVILTFAFAIIFTIPTIWGTKSMAVLNYISIPLMIIIVVYGTVRALSFTGVAGIAEYMPTNRMTLFWGANLMVGGIINGCAFVSDYTRWQKDSVRSVTASAIGGLYPFCLLLGGTGMMMAIAAVGHFGIEDPWNIVSVMTAIGMPSISLLLIFLLLWTSAVTSIYSSGLVFTKIFKGKRWIWSFVVSIAAAILALTGIINSFMGFMNLLACWISPVVGVIFGEYYFVSKRELKLKGQAVYWPGVVCWIAGGLVAWLTPNFFIPALTAIIVSGGLYILYHALFAKAGSGGEKQEIVP